MHPKGKLVDWDGLTNLFIELVDKNTELLEDSYIKNWYVISRRIHFTTTRQKKGII